MSTDAYTIEELLRAHREAAAAYTIDEFCRAHRFSRATYYTLKKAKRGPREMDAGGVRISREAAADFRLEREAERAARESAARDSAEAESAEAETAASADAERAA